MNKFYILADSYTLHSAPNNRLMALVRGFSELGVMCELVFLRPGPAGEKYEGKLQGVSVNYLWKLPFSKMRVIKEIYKTIALHKFKKKLKTGDKVFLFGLSEFVDDFSRIPGIHCYHERTEHPDAAGKFKNITQKNEYFEACKRIDGIFVITRNLKEYMATQGIPNDKIEIINMVVDPYRFDNTSPSEYKKPYIAYCGSASNTKDGLDILIRSFALVHNRYKELKLYILSNPFASEDNNYSLIKELGLVDSVICTGLVSSDKVPSILNDAEILVLARPDSVQSRYGFPQKLGEYLSTGKPVVTTAVGELPLFLKDGENAYLARCNDAEDFATKLLQALDNKEEAAQIGENGKKTALENFNYLIEAKKIINKIFS